MWKVVYELGKWREQLHGIAYARQTLVFPQSDSILYVITSTLCEEEREKKNFVNVEEKEEVFYFLK